MKNQLKKSLLARAIFCPKNREYYSGHYKETDRHKYNLVRVDSSMVSETVGKLAEGLSNSGKKAIKHSAAFDRILPCNIQAFTSANYSSEDVALHEVVLSHVEKRKAIKTSTSWTGGFNLHGQ